MKQIVIGQELRSRKDVKIDVAKLLRSRLLIQASSGGGKSYLLRGLAEQLHPFAPTIIIDPEGEFATLREKFPFVLVGPGGETPADPRSAALVATRLLELRASAVCDIYELKSHERTLWVKLFLDAMISAPKKLWKPTFVIVDEAHLFMPEKSAGESAASGAMVDLTTLGRKRGFGAIFATQRLAKLLKNGTAELQNRMIGPTYEGIDLDRAADELSIPRRERDEWFRTMRRDREPGTFEVVGPAIGRERLVCTVGGVQTTHPEVGGRLVATPPTPRSIAKLLPQLADLPHEAETKSLTEAELRKEIRELKAAAVKTAKALPPLIETKIEHKRVEVPVLKKGEIVKLERCAKELGRINDRMTALGELIEETLRKVRAGIPLAETAVIADLRIEPRKKTPLRLILPGKSAVKSEIADAQLTNPQLKILNALAWWESIGVSQPSWMQVAVVCGVVISGSFTNNKSRLSAAGLVTYPRSDHGELTAAGAQIAVTPAEAPTLHALHEKVLSVLTGPQAKILEVALQRYPAAVTLQQIFSTLGIVSSGSFINNRSRLHALGFVDYVGEGRMKSEVLKASEILFPEGLS